MEIREAKPDELNSLASIYKQEHSGHVLFQGNEKDIEDYLERLDMQYVVMLDQQDVVGGVAVLQQLQAKNHSVFQLKHFAVLKEYVDKAQFFMNAMETRLDTGKIELHLSDKDTPDIEFFMQLGFEIEGTLSNHYKIGEKCYIMGKTIENAAAPDSTEN
jgi:ribosomal protein S18 acetylase RimI-like enzyme